MFLPHPRVKVSIVGSSATTGGSDAGSRQHTTTQQHLWSYLGCLMRTSAGQAHPTIECGR